MTKPPARLAGERQAAALRFKGGDLLIKLSRGGSRDILVHSSVVRATCPVLAPALTPDGAFQRSEMVKLPGQDELTRLYTLAMKFVQPVSPPVRFDVNLRRMDGEGTFTLEGTAFTSAPQRMFCWEFHGSELSTGGWPDFNSHLASWPPHAHIRFDSSEESAACQYMVIMRILHRMDFKLEDLEFWRVTYNLFGPQHIKTHGNRLCSMLARAEYLGCLSIIWPAVLDKLMTMKHFGTAVMLKPECWLELAVKMRSQVLYFDALRHLMASKDDKHREFLVAHWNMTLRELKTYLAPILLEQMETLTSFRIDLKRLELFDADVPIHGTGRKKFLLKTKAAHGLKTEDQKAQEISEQIAKSFWSQWLAQQEVGGRIFASFENSVVPARTLQEAIAKIEAKVKQQRPIRAFGQNTMRLLVERHGLDHRTGGPVWFSLSKIVEDADAIIKEAFATREGTNDDGERVVYRRAMGDVNPKYWTYLPCNEESVPWPDVTNWPPLVSNEAIYPVCTTRASRADFEAIRIALRGEGEEEGQSEYGRL